MPASLAYILQDAHAPVNAVDSITQSCLQPEQVKIDKSAMGVQMHCNVFVSVTEVRSDSQAFSSPP